LKPDSAAKELELRRKFISAEQNLFLTRRERAIILVEFKAIYGPVRKWSQFLRTIGIARRTAYDLLDVVEGIGQAETAEGNDCASSAQSALGKEKSPLKYGFDHAVDRSVASLNRILKQLDEAQRERALIVIMDRVRCSPMLKLVA
jgi:hypothetical protein